MDSEPVLYMREKWQQRKSCTFGKIKSWREGAFCSEESVWALVVVTALCRSRRGDDNGGSRLRSTQRLIQPRSSHHQMIN